MNTLPRLLLLALLLTLAACKPRPAPSAHTLMLTPKDFAAIASIETVMEIDDDPKAAEGPANEDMRQFGIISSGRYRYHLKAPDGGVYKVHIVLFANEARAVKDWQGRHRPEALAATSPLPLDKVRDSEGWIYPSAGKGEMSAVRVGRAVIEIQARGAPAALAPFSRAIAKHASGVLRN